MIQRLFAFSLKQRIFILLSTIILGVLGFFAFEKLPIDVFPDPSPPLVQVYTEAHGMAPEEVETLISYPIESAMFGLPRVKNIRSFSTFALSLVNVYFEDGTDIYWARQLVSQRLLEVRDAIPDARPTTPCWDPWPPAWAWSTSITWRGRGTLPWNCAPSRTGSSSTN